MVPVVVLVAAAVAGSAARAQSCGDASDDADVVACAQSELQEQVDKLLHAYDTLSEALGPRAATGLPADQAQWLSRVAGHCGIAAAGDLESVVAGGLDTPRTLCLSRFVEARADDLNARNNQATELAAAFAAAEYPTVPSTWGDRLNPDGKAPLDRFEAYYLRSGQPATLVASDTVDEVSINYPWSEFHGIKSEDFEGYWVGRFRYRKETSVYISVDQSWSRTRVIIDRKLVYEGGSNARVPFVFQPGTHTVEVEYVNNWHTTGLSVSLAEAVEPVGRSELRGRLRALAPENAVVQFAGVYESGSRDNTVALKLAPAGAPVILVLSSYSAVRWVIDNPERVDVRAIVHGSYAPGSRVQINGRRKTVPGLLVEQGLGSYDVMPRCRCTGGNFTCEGGNLDATVQTLSALLGFPVTGFAGAYSPPSLALPGIAITPAVMADARAALEELGRERGECRKSTRIEQ